MPTSVAPATAARVAVRSGKNLLRTARSRPARAMDRFVPWQGSGSPAAGVRLLRADDGPAWTAGMRANAERMGPWWPRVDDWNAASDEVAFAEHFLHARTDQQRGTSLPVVLTADDALISELTMWRMERGGADAELGMWASPEAPSSCIATALVHAFDIFFGPMALQRIESPVAVGNTWPHRALKLIGYTMEGIAADYRVHNGQRHDYELWALTARQWHDHRQSPMLVRLGGAPA